MNNMQYRPSQQLQTPEQKQWGMFVHLSLLANAVIPPLGLIAPIVLWQMKKDEMPGLDAHGKMVTNWVISSVIYMAVCGILSLVIIGVFGLMAVYVMNIVFAVVGGLKANNGELWEYPLTIKFLK